MGRTEVYTSRKKSVWLLAGLVVFVTIGICMLLVEDHPRGYGPVFVKILEVASILFFGLGIYVSVKWLVKNQLILVIDEHGIDINPSKPSSAHIAWEYIKGFSEIRIHGTKIIVIQVDNPKYWIKQETNAIRKKMMEFNVNYCESPFNISANATRLSHAKLMELLNDNLRKHRIQ